MTSIKAQKEINKAVRHLMDFITESPLWSPRFDELMEAHFDPIADQLDLPIEEVSTALLEGPYEHMVWDFLSEQMATMYWDNEKLNPTEDYLKTRGWREGAHGRRYLRAFAESDLEFWEVTAVEQGAWIDVRPYGSEKKPVRVQERTASQTIAQWTPFVARVIPLGSKRLFSGSILPLTIEAAPRAQRVLEKSKADMKLFYEELVKAARADGITDIAEPDIDDEPLSFYSEVIFAFWAVDVMRYEERAMPQMRNTDNEDIVITRYRFQKLGDQSFIKDQLSNHPAIISDEEPDNWVWLKGDDSNTVLGRFELANDQLHFETNSVERGTVGLKLLESLLGDELLQAPITVYENIDAMSSIPSLDQDSDAAIQSDPEMQSAIQSHLMQHYRKTLDEPIPMLDNETPRDCAADPLKRSKVVDWLKTLEHSGKNMPGIQQDLEWMWHELELQEFLPQSPENE